MTDENEVTIGGIYSRENNQMKNSPRVKFEGNGNSSILS